MAKIRFNLKSPKQKMSLIVMVIRHQGSKAVLSTGQVVDTRYWNLRGMRVREQANYPEAMEINHVLNRYMNLAIDAASELTREYDSPRGMRAEDVKERIQQKIGALDRTGDRCSGGKDLLTELIDSFIDDARKRKMYAPSTLQGYVSLKELIVRYSDGEDVDLDSLGRDYYKGFQEWMFDKNYATNYVQKQWSRLKTVVRFGVDEGKIEDQEATLRKLPVKKVETDHIYLTEEEIDKMAQLDLEDNPRLGRVRDIFLVGAYTGLRYCDLIKLNTDHILEERGAKIIRMVTKKTNRKVVVPCKPIVCDILDRYGGGMPQISDVNYNRYLKELGERAGLTSEEKMRYYHGGEMRMVSFKKWEKLSSHTARRSFATNLFKQGVSPVAIQKMTGHTNTKVLMSYIKMDGEEVAVNLANNAYFQ